MGTVICCSQKEFCLMSTNPKNIIRPEYLKNFTRSIKRRNVVVESGKQFNFDLQSIINSVNTKINQIIQLLNISIKDRQIPYITLTIRYSPELDENSRIIIRTRNMSDSFLGSIKEQTGKLGIRLSHCIEILSSPGYKEIVISSLSYDAEIVIAEEFLECALIDVLLDIVMFNSYSFLAGKTLVSKRDFSNEKYEYFKENRLNCFYEYKTNKKLYYSFAFSARKSENEFNINKYIEIWDEFVNKKYSEYTHKEKSISEQLKQHVDYQELPKNLNRKFNRKPAGSYLILRTNKDRTENLHPNICTFFGLNEYERGKIKIIPIEEIDSCKEMLKNLDVSAFKIVKSPNTSKNRAGKNKQKTHTTSKKNKTKGNKRFKIALSFPGEYRDDLVSPIANKLSGIFDKESILYDKYIEDELAAPDLDLILEDYYLHESILIVVFVCNEYAEKKWCGIEWRVIRELINDKKNKNRIMFIKCNEDEIEWLPKNTGYLHATTHTIDQLVNNIQKRYTKLETTYRQSKEKNN